MSLLSYIHNRWIAPSDRVIIRHPEYTKGQYHDADTRMLFILFQMVVDFVEIELGCRYYGIHHFETLPQKIHRILTDIPGLTWFIPPMRNARRGLHHLRWAMKLQDSPSQAQQAKDVFTLYTYWKHTRPRRVDPWQWAETFEKPTRPLIVNGRLNFSPEYSAMLDKAGALEEQQHQEDEEMLHLLMTIRRGLWT